MRSLILKAPSARTLNIGNINNKTEATKLRMEKSRNRWNCLQCPTTLIQANVSEPSAKPKNAVSACANSTSNHREPTIRQQTELKFLRKILRILRRRSFGHSVVISFTRNVSRDGSGGYGVPTPIVPVFKWIHNRIGQNERHAKFTVHSAAVL